MGSELSNADTNYSTDSLDAVPKAISSNEEHRAEVSRPAIRNFDISGPDIMVLSATINKQTAQRNLMIPLLAKKIDESEQDDDLHAVFLQTIELIRKSNKTQVPELRTTMGPKICLKKIFNAEDAYKSSVKLNLAQKIYKLFS